MPEFLPEFAAADWRASGKWAGPLTLFVLRAPVDAIEGFELTQGLLDGFVREWCLPAELLNECEILDVRQVAAAPAISRAV